MAGRQVPKRGQGCCLFTVCSCGPTIAHHNVKSSCRSYWQKEHGACLTCRWVVNGRQAGTKVRARVLPVTGLLLQTYNSTSWRREVLPELLTKRSWCDFYPLGPEAGLSSRGSPSAQILWFSVRLLTFEGKGGVFSLFMAFYIWQQRPKNNLPILTIFLFIMVICHIFRVSVRSGLIISVSCTSPLQFEFSTC